MKKKGTEVVPKEVPSRAVVLLAPAAGLTPEEVVQSYAVVTRATNALGRRQRELRKEVDRMFAEEPVASPRTKFVSGDFAIVRENGSYGEKVVDPNLAIALVEGKGKLRGIVFDQPPPVQPPPAFSLAKFESLRELGLISADEYEACRVPAPPKPSVTVEVDEVMDRAISESILGRPDPKPEALAAPKRARLKASSA